jgi:hypothetical protein
MMGLYRILSLGCLIRLFYRRHRDFWFDSGAIIFQIHFGIDW